MGLAMEGRGYFAAVPIAGPFIAAATYHPPQPPCNAGWGCLGAAISHDMSAATVRGLLVINGVVQVAGTAMLIAGLASQRWTLVPDETPRVMPVPMVGTNGGGLGFVGRF
jgi:hypothetical protein